MVCLRPIVMVVSALAGCIGSSVPQPPNLHPIDPTRVVHDNIESHGDVELRAGPGAAPPLADVWAWDLDSGAPPAVASTDFEGAFVIVLPPLTREVRFQARRDGMRSEPVDVAVGAPSAEIVRPSCLVVPREVVLGPDRTAEIAIRNQCGADVPIDRFELRYGEPDLVVEPPATPVLRDGAEIVVGVRALGVATIEDILFVFATVDGRAERYPISLLVHGGS